MKKQFKEHRKWYDRSRVYSKIAGESMTSQSDRDHSDVNYIVSRFQRTGELPKNPRGLEPRYEDVTPLQENLTDAYNKAAGITENYHQFLAEQKEKQQIEEQKEQEQQPQQPAPASDASVGAEGEDKGA